MASEKPTAGESQDGDKDTVAVGRCPDHGIVWGYDAVVNFPTHAECRYEPDCGRELEQAGYADLREVKKIAE